MAEATEKNPEIDKFIVTLTGRDRVETIDVDRCTTCGGAAASFRDSLSEQEYRISGMCQDCQDSVFGV